MPWFSCEWRFLAHLVYPVPAEVMTGWLPPGLAPDPFDGSTYVAVCAAQCKKPRWRGLPVLKPEGFNRVRLQAYVRAGQKRGVFALSEIYSMKALATLLSSGNRFGAKGAPLVSEVEFNPVENGSEGRVVYKWGEGLELSLQTEGLPVPAEMWPEEQFFVDSRYGFGPRSATRAERGSWFVWEAKGSRLMEGAARDLAGDLAGWLKGPPAFAYLAKGGPVSFTKAKLT